MRLKNKMKKKIISKNEENKMNIDEEMNNQKEKNNEIATNYKNVEEWRVGIIM